MRIVLLSTIAAVIGLVPASLRADELPVGYISYDVVGLNTAEFDLINETGPNSSIFPDTTFPVTNSVSFLDLMLTVDFASGPPIVYDSSYFTLAPDGLSFDGLPFSTGTDPISAVLTGTFSTTTVTLNDGTVVNIGPTFTATITDISGGNLQDADLAVIYAMTTGTSGGVPEPSTWVLFGAGLFAVIAFRLRHNLRGLLRATSFFLLIAGCVLLPLTSASAAPAAIHLNVDTAPSAGSAGITFVNVTGSGFPTGTIPPANVSITLALSCGSSTTIPATAISVTPVVGTADKIEFELPASLETKIYYVAITGSTATGNPFASSDCSAVSVTNNTKGLASCVPTSSLAVLTGTNVVAYVPNGAWSYGANGVQVVPIEGAGSPSTITTPNPVNSCSSNAFTGVTVCTANNTDVYVISGSTLTSTLTSGSNSFAGFTGGDCQNCGVAINALTNQAVIAMGYSPSPSGSAIQFLNLATDTFNAPIPTNYEVSEDIAVDPTRNLLLSPSEDQFYDLFQIASDSSLTEFGTFVGGTLDSAAEDCSTGIALSTIEFSQSLVLTDLTQAVFTPGAPGSWTAPSNTMFFPDFNYFSAGTSGISVAPGTTHLGITTGEFGGNAFSAFLLPSTSGTGTPAVVDFASALMPATPDGCGFAQGLDPHTVTAYTSPNNNKAYGLMASAPPPAWIGVVDLQALLAAPRIPGQDPAGNPCSLCLNSVDPSYDLVANGVVRYVSTGNPNCADFAKRVPQGQTKPIVPKASTREGQKLFKHKSK